MKAGRYLRRAPEAVLALGSLVGCSGEPLTQGFDEPLRVQGAQFIEGKLPGRPPLTAQQLTAGKVPVKPFATPPEVLGRILRQTEVGFRVSGRASTDSYAVGFQIEDAGSGYWLLPVGSPDPTSNDELTWRATVDLGPSIEPGLRKLLVAAVDETGRSGTQRGVELCVRSPVADNLNACAPAQEPPALVVNLSWGNAADLDLRVLSADGSLISDRSVSGEEGTSGGLLERDANSNCSAEGAPTENVLWQVKPAPGLYFVYVNLNDSCGEAAAPFTVSTHVSKKKGDEFSQLETFRVAGELLAIQANGGGQLGTFITEIRVK